MALDPLDDATHPIYTVGQAADLLGVAQAFLRRLDALDVVSPARSAGAQRRYSRADLERVEQAVGLIDEGLTLAGVRRVFALQAQVDELRAEIARLRGQPVDRADA